LGRSFHVVKRQYPLANVVAEQSYGNTSVACWVTVQPPERGLQ
jgi:hypothetical protein